MFCLKIIQINVAGLRIMHIFAIRFERNEVLTREHSSVGLEHLPYKQRVGGSTPSAPTTKPWIRPRLFSLFCDERSFRGGVGADFLIVFVWCFDYVLWLKLV